MSQQNASVTFGVVVAVLVIWVLAYGAAGATVANAIAGVLVTGLVAGLIWQAWQTARRAGRRRDPDA